MLHGKPLKIVRILPIEIFYQWFLQEEANSSTFWGPGIFNRVTLHEEHWLGTSRIPIGKFRMCNCTLLKKDSCVYNMHMTFCKLCLEPQYKWMYMATPLVNGINDLDWMLHCLVSLSRLTQQLPPDTFIYTCNFDDNWVTGRSNVAGTDAGTWFTPVAYLYQKLPEFRLPVK